MYDLNSMWLLGRRGDDGEVREISAPLSTHHNMQVERMPDGHLVYHDRIKARLPLFH